jgi:hypothetical protein
MYGAKPFDINESSVDLCLFLSILREELGEDAVNYLSRTRRATELFIAVERTAS